MPSDLTLQRLRQSLLGNCAPAALAAFAGACMLFAGTPRAEQPILIGGAAQPGTLVIGGGAPPRWTTQVAEATSVGTGTVQVDLGALDPPGRIRLRPPAGTGAAADSGGAIALRPPGGSPTARHAHPSSIDPPARIALRPPRPTPRPSPTLLAQVPERDFGGIATRTPPRPVQADAAGGSNAATAALNRSQLADIGTGPAPLLVAAAPRREPPAPRPPEPLMVAPTVGRSFDSPAARPTRGSDATRALNLAALDRVERPSGAAPVRIAPVAAPADLPVGGPSGRMDDAGSDPVAPAQPWRDAPPSAADDSALPQRRTPPPVLPHQQQAALPPEPGIAPRPTIYWTSPRMVPPPPPMVPPHGIPPALEARHDVPAPADPPVRPVLPVTTSDATPPAPREEPDRPGIPAVDRPRSTPAPLAAAPPTAAPTPQTLLPRDEPRDPPRRGPDRPSEPVALAMRTDGTARPDTDSSDFGPPNTGVRRPGGLIDSLMNREPAPTPGPHRAAIGSPPRTGFGIDTARPREDGPLAQMGMPAEPAVPMLAERPLPARPLPATPIGPDAAAPRSLSAEEQASLDAARGTRDPGRTMSPAAGPGADRDMEAQRPVTIGTAYRPRAFTADELNALAASGALRLPPTEPPRGAIVPAGQAEPEPTAEPFNDRGAAPRPDGAAVRTPRIVEPPAAPAPPQRFATAAPEPSPVAVAAVPTSALPAPVVSAPASSAPAPSTAAPATAAVPVVGERRSSAAIVLPRVASRDIEAARAPAAEVQPRPLPALPPPRRPVAADGRP
ncbi:MAG: hypothetical protein ACK4QW_13760, partial [Alphaproteobacteria bacterium]